MDLLFSYAQKFFSLPVEKKTAISIDKCPSYNGYVKSGTYRKSVCKLNMVGIFEHFVENNSTVMTLSHLLLEITAKEELGPLISKLLHL